MPQGITVAFYLPLEAAMWLQDKARASGMTVHAYAREEIVKTMPERVRPKSALSIKIAKAARKAEAEAKKAAKPVKPAKPPGNEPKPSIEELAEKHRESVLELNSRAYLPSQIAASLRIPYAAVEIALTTKAKPKKR